MGVSAVGLELSKNLILAGPQSVTLWDSRACKLSDYEWNYYLDINKISSYSNRADNVIQSLQELNSYVKVNISPLKSLNEFINESTICQYDVVVLADYYPLEYVYQMNELTKKYNVGFISVAVSGMLGHVFTDYGFNHVITDPNGEPKIMALVTGITSEGVIYTEDKQHHGFYENDVVVFKEVVGMEGLNGKTFKVLKVLSPYSF